MQYKELTKVGLSDAEAHIYYAVLQRGEATVKEIARDSGFHRTNVYDVLDKLKEKGLITFYKSGKTTIYKAADPENLSAYLREKQLYLDSLMPDLKKSQALAKEEISVEVYKGAEGMKAAWRDMIKDRKTLYGWGVAGQLREHLPEFSQQFLRDLKRYGIKYYGIYVRGQKEPPHGFYTEVRYVPPELSSPVATFVYGDKVNINLWKPIMIAIIIKSAEIARTYRDHFNLLWKTASKE